MRVIGAVLVASLVAMRFGLSIVAVSEESWWRFWGSVYGTFATGPGSRPSLVGPKP